MSKPIPILDLTQTQEFGAAPLEKKLGALDAAFTNNAGLFDEAVYDKTPFSKNDPWVKGRALLADTYSKIRDNVSVADLQQRLQRHATESGSEVDPTVVSRIISGGDVDEEEDAGGALRGIVDGWTKELASVQGPHVRKGGNAPPLTSYPLLNPGNDKEVMGSVAIYGDGKTRPYAEIMLPDPDTEDGQLFTRVLLDDDQKQKLKTTEEELAKASGAFVNPSQVDPAQMGVPIEAANAMNQRGLERRAADVERLMTRHKTLSGPQGYVANLQEQLDGKLKEAPFIDKIGRGGFVNGVASAIGSVMTSGMGVAPGVMSLAGIGDDTGPVQHVTDPKIVSQLVADKEAGKLEGQILTPYMDKEGNQGVTLRNETEIEKMQKLQEETRNMFPNQSRREFRGSELDRVIVGATDDALPFLADLYSGMALAKGTMIPVRMAMTSKAAKLGAEASKLGELAHDARFLAAGGVRGSEGIVDAVNASAKARIAGELFKSQSLTSMKNIAKYTTIPEALIAGMPMTVKGAAHSWSDAMHTADEFDSQGKGEQADRARDNAFDSAWANFATGEGLALLPMMRVMRNKNGDNLLKISHEKMAQREGWDKFLHQQVFHRAAKSAEFGAWTGSTAMASNAWAKALYDDNRELFRGVKEATAIGMIHGFGLARFSGLVDPREVQSNSARIKNEAASVQQTTELATEALNRQKAGTLFDNLARVLPPDQVVDQRTADGKFVINDPSTPGFHGMEFATKEEAVQAATGRHREQFFQDIAEYQQRIGMKPDDVNAQNTTLGAAMDNVARLAGVDPARYYASITVRDRPEGEQGPYPQSDSFTNMKSRLDNLFDLIGHAEKNKVPQLILDKMMARHNELRQEIYGPDPVPVNPAEAPPAQVTPPDSQAPAVTPPAQTGEAPPVAKPSQGTPEAQTSTTRRNGEWYKDRTMPQAEFERNVTEELATLQRLEAEAQADLQAGKLDADGYQSAVDWITKRQSDIQAEEVGRKDSAEQRAAAVQQQIMDINAKIAAVLVKEGKVGPDSAQRAALITERRALEADRRALATPPPKAYPPAPASPYPMGSPVPPKPSAGPTPPPGPSVAPKMAPPGKHKAGQRVAHEGGKGYSRGTIVENTEKKAFFGREPQDLIVRWDAGYDGPLYDSVMMEKDIPSTKEQVAQSATTMAQLKELVDRKTGQSKHVPDDLMNRVLSAMNAVEAAAVGKGMTPGGMGFGLTEEGKLTANLSGALTRYAGMKRMVDSGFKNADKAKMAEAKDALDGLLKRADEMAGQKLNQEQGSPVDPNASIYALADQGQVIIETYKNANPTSLLHEVAHTWTLMVDPVTGKSLLEHALGSKADAFNAWASQGGKVEIGSVPYHETVAKGWEKYLSEGKAPTEELKGVFAKLSQMFRQVYKNLKNSVPLPDEARAAYDRLFDPKAERELVADNRPVDPAEPVITPDEAAVKLEMFEDGNLVGLHQLNDPEFRRGLAEIGAVPHPVMPDEGAPQRLDQGPSRYDDFRTMVWSNKEAAKRKMKEAWQNPKFWDKWEGFIPAGMRSRGRMPVEMFDAKASAHGLKDAITTRAEINASNLNTAMREAIGIKPNVLNYEGMSRAEQAAFNTLTRDVNAALMGADNPAFSALPRARKLAIQAGNIAALPPNVQPHVLAMRAHMDSLTRALISTGAVQGPLVATLDANEGFYMNRTYEFFDNPIHGDTVRRTNKPLMDQSINEFMAGGMTRAQAEAEVEYLLSPENFTGTKTGEEGYAKFLTDRRPGGIFKERTDIPEHIRKLWGEYKDPMLNYARTVSKQAAALTTFQYHLQTLAEGTRDGWLKANKDKEHPVEIFKSDDQSPRTNPRKSPLSGYYTTPEIASVFREVEKQGVGADSTILSLLAGGNWLAKNNVFTWNPASHVRNGVGSAILYFSNGHYAGNRLWSNLKDTKEAAMAHAGILPEFWQQALANKVGMDRNAANAERVRLTRLGLIGQNVDIGVLNSLAKRFSNGVLNKNDSLSTVAGHIEGLAGKAQKGLEDAIQAEDSFWKAMHFYSEYKVLRDAYPSTGPGAKTNGELEIIAAGRTLDVMPSWDRVVPWAKKFSSNPFMGTFVSFRAETMRNTYNALKYGVQDLQTPGMRWHGIRRLAGMTGLRAAQGAAAKGLTKLMMGTFLDEDTEKKVRLLMNPWDVDSTQAFEHVGDGKIRHLNLSYIFPMSETIDALRAVGNQDSMVKMGWAGFAKTFEPFLNEEFSLRLAHEIAFNKDGFGRPIYNTEDTVGGMSWDMLTHGASMLLEPALLKNAKRVVRSYEGVGGESPKSAWSRIVGFRINEIDVRKQLPMVTADLANRLATADALFSEHFDPAKGSEADLAAGFAKMNERREFLYKRLHDIHDAGLATGVPHSEVITLMDNAVDRNTKESLSEMELISAITGKFVPPYQLSENKFLQLYQKDKKRAELVLKMTGQPLR
jgi:hypothetical protein